jgi:hypothetical protein
MVRLGHVPLQASSGTHRNVMTTCRCIRRSREDCMRPVCMGRRCPKLPVNLLGERISTLAAPQTLLQLQRIPNHAHALLPRVANHTKYSAHMY